jgi:hypothetical protein
MSDRLRAAAALLLLSVATSAHAEPADSAAQTYRHGPWWLDASFGAVAGSMGSFQPAGKGLLSVGHPDAAAWEAGVGHYLRESFSLHGSLAASQLEIEADGILDSAPTVLRFGTLPVADARFEAATVTASWEFMPRFDPANGNWDLGVWVGLMGGWGRFAAIEPSPEAADSLQIAAIEPRGGMLWAIESGGVMQMARTGSWLFYRVRLPITKWGGAKLTLVPAAGAGYPEEELSYSPFMLSLGIRYRFGKAGGRPSSG